VQFLAGHRDRTPYLHFKDINPVVHQKVLSDGIGFFDAISLGVFVPVGQGMVDFGALAAELANGFDGPGTIEQDRDFRATTTAWKTRRPASTSSAVSASPTRRLDARRLRSNRSQPRRSRRR
jgi:sugar phosphate isomerase/epimerase